MKVNYVKKLMLSGLSCVTNKTLENDDSTAKIPQLWQDYADQNIEGKTFNKSKSMSMYAYYNNYEDGLEGDFSVTIAVEVSKPKNALVIENQRYLVFSKKGELPDVVQELWQEIEAYFEDKPEYERAFSVDFEKYSKEDFVEIYISIL